MNSALRLHKQSSAILVISLIGALAGLLVRLPFVNMLSHDIIGHLGQWYDYIVLNGGVYALGDRFADYTPAYLYLLTAAAYLREVVLPVISTIAAIKLPSLVADVVMAMAVYNIIRLTTRPRIAPAIAFGMVLVLPTVFINSAVWGQADGIYAAAVLWCIYLLCARRPALAMVVFGIAVSLKLQSVFISPLLLFLLVRRQLHVTHLLIVPAMYALLILPVILVGRAPLEAIGSYVVQAGEYHQLSLGAPNLYIFAPADFYQRGVQAGLLVGAVAGFMIALAFIRSRCEPDADAILACALVCVMIMPFVLPKLHERYFYLADVISLLAAFRWRRLFWLPVAYQFISLSAYATVLQALGWWNSIFPDVKVFTWLNALVIAITVPAVTALRVRRTGSNGNERRVAISTLAGGLGSMIVIMGVAILLPGARRPPNQVESTGSLFPPATSAAIVYAEGDANTPLIELVSYSLPQPRTYRTGIMKIYMFFRPLRPLTKEYRLRIDAYALDGRSLELFNETPADESLLSAWEPGALYQQRRFVTIWPTVDAPQLATLKVSWIDPQTGTALKTTCADLACDSKVAVIPIGLDYGAAAPWLRAPPINTFGERKQLALLDATSDRDGLAGQSITVTTTWRLAANAQPLDDLTFFVHAVSPNGKMIAQNDAQPRGGAYPTHAWHPGEVVIDVMHMFIPADTTVGQYDLQLGAYRSDTQERIQAHAGSDQAARLPDDIVALGAIRIQR